MALSQSTLASEMEAAITQLTAPGAPSAEQAQAQAFGDYFKDATHNGVAILPSPVDSLAVPAMVAAMAFTVPGTPSSGATALTAGYTAFWGAIVAAPVTFWPAAGVVTPAAGLATLATAIAVVFSTNNDPSITKAQAAANLASVIHPNAGLGGTALIGLGPAFAPIL